MPPAIDISQYDHVNDDFKTAAAENCWSIFKESVQGFKIQYSVWMTALKTERAASPVDQKKVDKLEYLVGKCEQIA